MTSTTKRRVTEATVACGLGIPVERLRHVISLGAPELVEAREYDDEHIKKLTAVFGEWVPDAIEVGLAMEGQERREIGKVLRKWPNPRILSVRINAAEVVNVLVHDEKDWRIGQEIPVKSVLNQRHWLPGCGRPKQVGKLPPDFDRTKFLGGL